MMRDKVIKLLATFFGIGYLSMMPGTFASVAGLLVYLVARADLSLYLSLCTVLVIIGFIVSGRAAELLNNKDPREVVIDEVCGIMLVYIAVPFSIFNLFLGFALFRLFDIKKPYPIKRLESIKGGWGIMLDDIGAAIYANIILQVLRLIL